MEMEYGRPLPPELLVEMHKCLPLDNQIYVLVNVSKTFVINNSTRMHRNVQRIKTSLNEYIGTLVNDGEDREELWTTDDLQWKPEMDALFRYGTWLTSTRKFEMLMDNSIAIIGVPKNFVEKLLLHMAYSRSPQWMLDRVEMSFGMAAMPIPTFMKPLLNKKKEHYQIGSRTLFESIQLETENGQILHIYDAELKQYEDNSSELRLFVMNKKDGNNWFRIIFEIDSSKEFIQQLLFLKWNMQSFDIANFVIDEFGRNGEQIEQNGNKLEAKTNIFSHRNLDIILRRGAEFSQFRHFTMKEPYYLRNHPFDYVDFLISSISNTKHPEDFLESIEMNLLGCSSSLIEKFWTIFYKGIPEVGISINLDNNKLHVLSAKNADNKSEFILANIPTNGAYVFDVEVQFGYDDDELEQIVGIKIQKRKNDDDIMELKCEDQIGLGKKTKAENDDENGPTWSGKIMKQ